VKKRAMKKWIPRNTSYCYKSIKFTEDGMPYRTDYCRNLVFDHYCNDVMVVPGDTPGTTKEIPCRWTVYRCRYTGVTTLEDPCLFDDVKICGVGEPEDYWNVYGYDDEIEEDEQMQA